MTATKHPSAFPPAIIKVLRRLLLEHLPPGKTIYDPFIGIGNVVGCGHEWDYCGAEIEPEWANQAIDRGALVFIGDARDDPVQANEIHAVVTSPAYGNRLADDYAPDMDNPKHSNRRSYRIALGRTLSIGNAGSMEWGQAYRNFHEEVWTKCCRALPPSGIFLLNVKNHIRGGRLQRVAEWHLRTLLDLGLQILHAERILLKGDQNTTSMRKRGLVLIGHEMVFLLRKETP